MQSLRTRRSQGPRRNQTQRQAQGGSSNVSNKLAKPGAGPTPRGSRKSRVDDKIKKRMSMRYADISSPTELNGIPAMPSLPMALIPGGGVMRLRDQDEVVKDRTGTREDARVVADDKKLLDEDDFDPDAFLKLKLANSTEAELKSLQSSLRDAKGDTASELQRNVFKNYAEFVLISKEISTLENEMLELKELLSEYKSMPSLLHIPDPTSTSSSTLSTYKRSSVADLRIMYFNQMQALHAQIEGSAKFAPTTPGRHVVGEVEGVLALNAATYKVTGKVKFVVLDDAVLVARRRRRTGGGGEGSVNEGKLVAERCWPLNEMLVLDTKDSPSMTNVFKIRHGKETHVYRTESPSDKKSLLSQFRQVAEELASKKRKEREGEHERRKSMWQGGGGDRSSYLDRSGPIPEWMADLTQRSGDTAGTDAKEKAERDARWTGEWADELTVAIALREWSKAVDLVEQGKAKISTTPPLAPKLPLLTSQLTQSLLTSLALPTNRKSSVVSLIALLLRLGAGAAARTAFLDMRTQVMRSHIRKIRFEGHVGSYVGDMAVVCFTGIKHTADWFLASFKENEVASAFIEWARKQIESYAEMFRKQVYTSDVDPQTVDEALKITYSQSKKLLQEYGLDFRFLLDELLVEKPKDVVKSNPPTFRPISKMLKPHPEIVGPTTPSRRRSPAPPPPSQPEMPPPSSYPPPAARARTGSGVGLSASSYQSQSTSAPPPIRSRTPIASAATSNSNSSSTGAPPPASAPPIPSVPVASPSPRRGGTKTPPPPSAPLQGGLMSSPLRGAVRERPPRAVRGSPAPPPRSVKRPGSAVSQAPPPVAVPQRDGMI